jgi:hypothetical protein
LKFKFSFLAVSVSTGLQNSYSVKSFMFTANLPIQNLKVRSIIHTVYYRWFEEIGQGVENIMINRERIVNLFVERTGLVKTVRKRVNGRPDDAGKTHFRRDFKEYGKFCRWAVMDNTDSEHLIILPVGAERLQCGLLVNRSLAQPGDRTLFEVLVGGKVVGNSQAGYEGGKVDVDIPLGGAREFMIRSRSLSKNAQVASDWLDPQVVSVTPASVASSFIVVTIVIPQVCCQTFI